MKKFDLGAPWRRRTLIKRTLALLLLAAVPAFAHAHLKKAVPADKAVVKAPPAQVQLTFSEEVNVSHSMFRVYPVATEAAAAALVKSMPAEGRADLGVAESPTDAVKDVVLGIKPGLKPGKYLVMWKVMAADDGHITQGSYTFTYTP